MPFLTHFYAKFAPHGHLIITATPPMGKKNGRSRRGVRIFHRILQKPLTFLVLFQCGFNILSNFPFDKVHSRQNHSTILTDPEPILPLHFTSYLFFFLAFFLAGFFAAFFFATFFTAFFFAFFAMCITTFLTRY